jgi:hypothetical protein
MIQFNETVADAYVSPARNVALPSQPGRQVRFLQGHASIKDGRDMVAMLRRPDVKIVPNPYAMNWWSTWVHAAGVVKAEVLLPQPDPNPDPKPEEDDGVPKDPEPEPQPEPEPVPQARRRSSWDLPRDARGRIMPRTSQSGADGTQPRT